jgi:hypothetical protein
MAGISASASTQSQGQHIGLAKSYYNLKMMRVMCDIKEVNRVNRNYGRKSNAE